MALHPSSSLSFVILLFFHSATCMSAVPKKKSLTHQIHTSCPAPNDRGNKRSAAKDLYILSQELVETKNRA